MTETALLTGGSLFLLALLGNPEAREACEELLAQHGSPAVEWPGVVGMKTSAPDDWPEFYGQED